MPLYSDDMGAQRIAPRAKPRRRRRNERTNQRGFGPDERRLGGRKKKIGHERQRKLGGFRKRKKTPMPPICSERAKMGADARILSGTSPAFPADTDMTADENLEKERIERETSGELEQQKAR